ncbi:hypothetical protein NM688_g7697 [Phlebia brevispora]|uniref:Uncharacterized protein n=1 Tax=Phlebia brevispora TaxID=194682 RepID=A0ACC1S2F5_9APHY|nr:hypothetical protein NM688_g7697 [Phlebia brevispora]
MPSAVKFPTSMTVGAAALPREHLKDADEAVLGFLPNALGGSWLGTAAAKTEEGLGLRIQAHDAASMKYDMKSVRSRRAVGNTASPYTEASLLDPVSNFSMTGLQLPLRPCCIPAHASTPESAARAPSQASRQRIQGPQ